MLNKPLIIRLFAYFLICVPYLRVAMISIEKGFPFMSVLMKAQGLEVIDIFNFWLLFPLSGFLILSVKSYSYILFIFLQTYGLYFHINYESYSWPYLSEGPTISAVILQGINLAFVFYILLPRNRATFFDKNLRWWERGSRFRVNEKCIISINGENLSGKMIDLSYSGAMIQLDYPLKIQDQITLDFEVMKKNFVVEGRVVRVLDQANNMFGVEFLFPNLIQQFAVRFTLLSMEKTKTYEKYR